jgi:hypothetical protein
MSETSGIFTFGEMGSPEVVARGNEALPSTFGEAMGAQFGQAFAENVGTRAARYAWNNLLPGSVLELQPDELNSRFGVPGRLTFDRPMTEHAARDLQEHHLANSVREDAIRRRGDNIGGGTVASVLTSLGAGLLDPLNIAAAFIPVGGEAYWAARLGSAAARGMAGRAAVRGVQGAISGFAGGLATEPVNWLLTRYDHDDYTMGNFLANITVGTVLGAALPAAAGALRDRYRGLPPWSPEMHDAARTQAIAALAEGRPVQAGQAMDFVAARDAQTELRQWYDAQTKHADQVDGAMRQAASREDVVRAAGPRLAELQLEAQKVRLELDDAHGRLQAHGIEPATRERLDEIDAELGRTIPKKRRADLERERTMLLEGQDWEGAARAGGDLEAGRTEAEIGGLSAIQRRTEAAIRLAEANLERAQKQQEAAGTILEQRQAAWAARRDMVRDMAAKTLRGVAWKIGAEVDPAEINRAAMRIMRAAPDEVDAAIQRELKAITDRMAGQMGPFKPGVVLRDVEPSNTARLDQAMQNLERNRVRSSDELADGQRGMVMSEPDITTKLNDAEIARAPKVEGTLDEMLADIEKANADIEARLRMEDQAAAAEAKRNGREAPKRDPALEEADAIREEGEQMAKAYEAAAVCAMRG